MARNLVTTNRTGQTMKLRELCQEWNPRRLRRLLKDAKNATDANGYLASNYFQQMRNEQRRANEAFALAKRQDTALNDLSKMLDRALERTTKHEEAIRALGELLDATRQELDARNGELAALRRETQ